MEFGHHTQVTIKCKNCGETYCFFPMRVIAFRACKCSNDDWGHYQDWVKGTFGNFTFINKEEVAFIIPTPLGEMEI